MSSTGALVRNSGATSATRPATGDYRVVFNRAVDACAFIAVVDPPGSTRPSSAQGFAHSVATTGNTSSVSVFTYASGGGGANRPFTLAILC